MNILKLTILQIGISFSTLWAQSPTGFSHLESQKLDFLTFMEEPEDSSYHNFWEELQTFAQELCTKTKKIKHSRMQIKKAFYLTQQKYLRRYQSYAGIESLIAKRNYDCVSGSALLYFLFCQLGYQVEIWESPHHVYLLLRDQKNDIFLIESTSLEDGVLANPASIQKRIAFYRRLERPQPGMSLSFSHSIHIRELAGLQFYNYAVRAFNQQDYHTSQAYLLKAQVLYPSQRIKSLFHLCRAHLDSQ